MAQLQEVSEKVERQIEAKYKYLADFAKEQYSPNLRKHYNDSFSKLSNSHGKRSSHKNSNQRRSPFRNSPRERRSFNHYSPSCSTFNPRRQITQDQFSPYDQKIDKEEERLNKQLLDENTLLRSQLQQSGDANLSLKAQLSKKQAELLQYKQMSQADLRYFEKVVSQMTNEIQLVLTKNKILQNQLVVVKSKLQEELRRQDQLVRIQEQRRRYEQYKKRDQFRRIDDGRRIEEQRRNTSQAISRRSVGKLMSRPTPTGNPNQQSHGTSKIKIQDQGESQNLSNLQATKTNENKSTVLNVTNTNVEKDTRKGQELINSIKSMQMKISGEQATSLKQLWKWLKGIGHTHSCLKRWKGKAAEASSYYPSDKLKQLIREACSYIE